jgi:hypothetical protein
LRNRRILACHNCGVIIGTDDEAVRELRQPLDDLVALLQRR